MHIINFIIQPIVWGLVTYITFLYTGGWEYLKAYVHTLNRVRREAIYLETAGYTCGCASHIWCRVNICARVKVFYSPEKSSAFCSTSLKFSIMITLAAMSTGALVSYWNLILNTYILLLVYIHLSPDFVRPWLSKSYLIFYRLKQETWSWFLPFKLDTTDGEKYNYILDILEGRGLLSLQYKYIKRTSNSSKEIDSNIQSYLAFDLFKQKQRFWVQL